MSFLCYLCLFAYNGVKHILCYVYVLFVFVLCTLCYQFLWIVPFWLPLRYSLTFILYSAVWSVPTIYQNWREHANHCTTDAYQDSSRRFKTYLLTAETTFWNGLCLQIPITDCTSFLSDAHVNTVMFLELQLKMVNTNYIQINWKIKHMTVEKSSFMFSKLLS